MPPIFLRIHPPTNFKLWPLTNNLAGSDIRDILNEQFSQRPLDLVLYFHNYRNMELKNAAECFAALAQETRLAALHLLIKQGPAGVSAGELAQALGIAAPTMSFHLKELANSALITSRKEGRSVIYAADYGGLRTLIDFMMADCCQGDPRLCGPYVVKSYPRQTNQSQNNQPDRTKK